MKAVAARRSEEGPGGLYVQISAKTEWTRLGNQVCVHRDSELFYYYRELHGFCSKGGNVK